MPPPTPGLWRLGARPLVLVAALAATIAPALSGCSGSRPAFAGAAPDTLGRAPDGLLARADLQALVDAQVLREWRPLAEALASPDAAVRARAALALGSVQAPEAVPALTGALQDSVPAVRADAAFALGQTADSTAAPFLFLALRREGTPAVQRELLDAVGKVGSRSDGDALLKLTLPPEREADRSLALARLAYRQRLSPEAFGALAGLLRAGDPAPRDRAAYAFARAGGWEVHAGAVRAAFDALASGDPARMHLARALGRLEDPQDAERLAEALQRDADWRVRANAAAALRPLATAREARAALTAALDDEVAHVRVAAASALAAVPALPAPYLDRFEASVAEPDTAEWHAQAALLPALARAGRVGPVLAWADAQTDPFAAARGLAALGVADDAMSLARLVEASGDEDTRIAGAAVGAERIRSPTWSASTTSIPRITRPKTV